MFRTVIISLVVLMVAGCATDLANDPSVVRFKSIVEDARAAEAAGRITESQKYRRFLSAFRDVPLRVRVGQGDRNYMAGYYKQRIRIAEAYENKRISTSNYLKLSRESENRLDELDRAEDNRQRREADRRWDNFMSAMQNLQDELDRPRREQNEYNLRMIEALNSGRDDDDDDDD